MPKDVVMIRAKVESATPDRTQWKPYATTLTFDSPAVYVEIPVPAEHVRKEAQGERLVLTLEGWTIFLDGYATAVEKMNNRWIQSFQKPGQHRPY